MNLLEAGNPGISRYRKQTLTTLDAVVQRDASIYAYTIRNASTSPAYLNIYNRPPGSVTVGGITPTLPVARVAIPAAPTGGFGEKVLSIGNNPVLWCDGGISIAPVLTDADSAAVGGTLYVEMDYAANPIVPTLQGN